VQLRGTGKSGKRWEAHIFGLDEVWRADLDGNGTQDYILFGSGPYFNGRTTPLFSLSILLMDDDGMPVPFFAVVYKGENGAGTRHLVDMSHDGHAALLISSYDEIPSDARVGGFCSGHWTNQLYRFRDLGAEEIRGTIAGITFPFVHDWTYRGTECAEEENPVLVVQPPVIYEHGTRRDGEVTTRIVNSPDASGLLAINPVAGCEMIRPNVVVYDRPRVREIGFPNLFTSYVADLADKVRRDGARVGLRGVNRSTDDGSCSVNLMWATPPLTRSK
jgi:hypothetical protein